MIPGKSFVHKLRSPFPSMRPTKRFVAISRDATGSGTLCSANNNRNRIVPRSSITAGYAKKDLHVYWLIAFPSKSWRRFRSTARARFCALTFHSLKNRYTILLYATDFPFANNKLIFCSYMPFIVWLSIILRFSISPWRRKVFNEIFTS